MFSLVIIIANYNWQSKVESIAKRLIRLLQLFLLIFPSDFSSCNCFLQYAELINIQRRLGGKDNFPLIEQTFYPTFKEMVCLSNSLYL